MVEFEWHRMADEQPTDEDACYLLIKNAKKYAPGLICVGMILRHRSNGAIEVHVFDENPPWMRIEDFKAWAKIPEYEMTPKQAAEYLGISASNVRAMLRAGTLKGFKVGTAGKAKWRVLQPEVARYKHGE